MAKKEIASQMSKLVDEFMNSSQSRKAFAAAHGIKEGKLQYWISKFTASEESVFKSSNLAQGFVPISLSTTEHPKERNILIRLQSGVEIEIPL